MGFIRPVRIFWPQVFHFGAKTLFIKKQIQFVVIKLAEGFFFFFLDVWNDKFYFVRSKADKILKIEFVRVFAPNPINFFIRVAFC